MAGMWKRALARHANALSFWAVLVVVGLALAFVVSLLRPRVAGPGSGPPPARRQAPPRR